MTPHNPLFAASQQVHGMAGQVGDKKLAFVLTGLSVALVAIMALREAKELFGDKGTNQSTSYAARHQGHADRAMQTQGYGRVR